MTCSRKISIIVRRLVVAPFSRAGAKNLTGVLELSGGAAQSQEVCAPPTPPSKSGTGELTRDALYVPYLCHVTWTYNIIYPDSHLLHSAISIL